MFTLIFVSFLWAFSFSLIGEFISGKMDIFLAINIRILLALVVLIPFLKWKHLFTRLTLYILTTGFVQIGLMYIFYFQSFKYLSVPEVALLTAFTPIYIQLMDFKSFEKKHFLALALCVMGAIVLKWTHLKTQQLLMGFFMIQMANLCFAFGQVYYKKRIKTHYLMVSKKLKDKNIFALFHLGALFITLPLSFFKSDFSRIPNTDEQYFSLLWLGIVASGLGYLLWNASTLKVNTTRLAVLNNLVIPLAILVNFLFWNRYVNWSLFVPGASLILISLYFSSSSKYPSKT